MTTAAVIVPSYRRTDALAACLAALDGQRLPPDAVVVVTRASDPDTAAAARAGAPDCVVVELDEPGVLAAMAAGARATTTDVVCFTDDDAVAPADWLERIVAVFDAERDVGGVGGRDVIVEPTGDARLEPLTTDVGRVSWFGRHTGNHHRGTGPARDVSFLKGVNAAYRREALGLPVGLRGEGAQAHFEVAVGRFARARRWRLVYDPSLAVEHRPASRQGTDQRDRPTPSAVADASYNLVVSIGGARAMARVLYACAVGDRGAPGLLRAAVALVRGDRATAAKLAPSLRGTVAGGWAVALRRGVTYETFA